jgi:hypothetical protein
VTTTPPHAPDCAKVCATCPWLVKNHGRPHKGGWYSKRNLLRLWNGLRLGKAPGTLCHSTDPNAPDYDGKPGAKPGGEKPCGGVIALICIETDALNRAGGYAQYAASREKPIARRAFAGIVSRIMFQEMPSAVDATEVIGLPWQQEKGASHAPDCRCAECDERLEWELEELGFEWEDATGEPGRYDTATPDDLAKVRAFLRRPVDPAGPVADAAYLVRGTEDEQMDAMLEDCESDA